MRELPTGVITLVFTDVEGSTRLLDELGDDAYADALADHHRLIRSAIVSHGGVEVDTQGDAFFVAFADADDALTATLEAQLSLARHPWSHNAPVRVRIGVHTGKVLRHSEGYVGITVHQAARIASTAHGGQIVVSSSTAQFVGTLPAGATLRSLGRHRLKDLGAALELHQVCHPELEDELPPLRSLERVRHNLPIQPSSFLGRDDELSAGAKMLAASRILSITGSGGIGKTRVCYQLAAEQIDDFPDGVWIAELAPLTEPTLVATVLASVLGLRDELGRSATETVVEHLRTRSALVVLDNCEHVIDDAAALAGALLRGCEGVRVLVTTREPLRIAGERVWALHPMELPDSTELPVEALASIDAVRLFCERAMEADANFALGPANAADVASICTRLEGVPLGIELAAAWVRSLSPAQISTRLGDALDLLTKGSRGAEARQASLRGAIAWSYDLLSEAEQRVFARLAVFTGGWTLDAAEEVCARRPLTRGDIVHVLDALVDKSLVTVGPDVRTSQLVDRSVEHRVDGDGPTRFGFLETIRQYAGERLRDLGELEATYAPMLDWCTSFAEEAAPHLRGHDQVMWLQRLDAEHDNVRGALAEALASQRIEQGLRLAVASWRFWQTRGMYSEGRRWLETLSEGADVDESLRACAAIAAGSLARELGDLNAAVPLLEVGYTLAVKTGQLDEASTSARELSAIALTRGDKDAAIRLIEESIDLARKAGDAAGLGMSLTDRGWIAIHGRELERAERYLNEALAAAEGANDVTGIGTTLDRLGALALFQGELERSRGLCERGLGYRRKVGDAKGIAYSLGNLGILALQSEDLEAARRYDEEALELLELIGDPAGMSTVSNNLGGVLRRLGEPASALGLLRRGLELGRTLGDPSAPFHPLAEAALVAADAGDHVRALALFAASESYRQAAGGKTGAQSENSAGRLATCRGELSSAETDAALERGRTLSLDEAIALAFP
jgi:predicted ATPase/class 3 adenylate cyclase